MEINCLTVGPIQENCYLLTDGADAVVIDPGDEPDDILSAIEGKTLQLIICTHAHLDHVGAVEGLRKATNAPFCLHRNDVPLLDAVPSMARLFGLVPFQPPKPDRILEGGETLTAGNISLKVLATPGHTPGGICLLGNGVLFSGDTLFAGSVGRTDLPGGSHAQLMQGIQTQLLTLADEVVVYPGHGPRTTIGTERRGNPFL